MSPKVIDESLPSTAPSAHLGLSKASQGLYVIIVIIGTSVSDENHSLTFSTSQVRAMAQWDNHALLT